VVKLLQELARRGDVKGLAVQKPGFRLEVGGAAM
jgi:hypothetical protein